MTGDPGSGKSYVTETICGISDIMHMGFVMTTSYNGIAAVNVDGSTLSSFFGISDASEEAMKQTLTEDKLLALRNRLDYQNICFLIIDEVSTIDTQIIALIDLRLQQVYGNILPFGGLPILFGGDFNQLGPVRKVFIPKDMVTFAMRLRKSGYKRKATPKTDNNNNNKTTPKKRNVLDCTQFDVAYSKLQEAQMRKNQKDKKRSSQI